MKRTVFRHPVAILLAALGAGCAAGVTGSVSGPAAMVASQPAAVPDLNGAAGKVFDFNADDGSFRFLKQDVTYDPVTGEGQPWHVAYVADGTVFVQSEGRRNLSGVKGPVIAIFTGIDEEAARAMKEGTLFRADKVVLRPDLKEATGSSDDGQRITGRFTPREARFSRDGTLKLGGKDVPAGVKRGGTRIFIQRERSAGDLARGFWKATLSGKPVGERFVAERMALQPLANPLETDDPKLPRVLSVGDSISMNYEKAARAELKGVANYHRIEDNCWSVHRGVAFMAFWLGDYTRPGLGWDVILFNSGLHDMKQKTLGGDYAVSLDVYKEKLRREIEIMKKTGATLVFCTTTPVPNDLGSAQYAFRSKGAEKDFNRAALEVLRDHPEILVVDLAKIVDESPVMNRWRNGKDVHFWKEEEQAVLGKAVAGAVTRALEGRRRAGTR